MSINNVDEALNKVGISIRDTSGGYRDFTDVLDELFPKWQELGELEQSGILKALAGTRQRENLLSLLQNETKYREALAIQQDAEGLAMERYGIYLESVEAKQNKMTAAWEKLIMTTANSNLVGYFYDLGTAIIGVLDGFTVMGNNIEILIPAIAGLVSYLGILYIQSLNLSVSAIPALIGSLKSLFAAFLTPQGAIALAIGTTVMAIQELIQYQEMLAQKNADNAKHWDSLIGKQETATDVTNAYREELERINKILDSSWAGGFIDKQEIINNGLKTSLGRIKETSKSWEEYKNSTEEVAKAAGYLIDEEGRLYRQHGRAGKEYADVNTVTQTNYELMMKLADTYESGVAPAETYWDIMRNGGQTMMSTAQQAKSLSDTIKELNESYSSSQGLSGKQFKGEFGFEDIESLKNLVGDDYSKYLSIENNVLKLNTDLLKENQLTKAKSALDTEKQAFALGKSTKENVAVLQNYVDVLSRATIKSSDFTQSFSVMIEGAKEAMAKTGQSTEAFDKVNNDLETMNRLYEDGFMTQEEYFSSLNEELSNMNVEETFGNNAEAAELFFTGLVSNTTSSLNQITTLFNAGEIDIVNYSQRLSELGDTFTIIGQLAPSVFSMAGMSAQEAASATGLINDALGGMSAGFAELNNLEQTNIAIMQGWTDLQSGTLQFGTEQYAQYAQNVANAMGAAGLSFQNFQGKMVTGSSDIYSSLMSDSTNMKLVADQMAQQTGAATKNVLTNAGVMLETLGNAIKNFKAVISFQPSNVEGGGLNLAGLFTGDAVQMPSFSYEITGSGGESTAGLGDAIAAFGQSLQQQAGTIQMNADIYLTDAQQQFNGLGGAVDNVKTGIDSLNNSLGGTGKASEKAKEDMGDLLKLTIKMIEDKKKRQKKALQEELAAYKKIIDARKESLELAKEEDDYQENVAEKTKEVSDIEAELQELASDTSEEAMARRLELQAELAKAQTELAEEQEDREYELKQQALDKDYEMFKEKIDRRIKIIDDYLAKSGKIAQDAMDLIENHSDTLYGQLIKWNSVYGDGLNSTIVSAWNAAYAALNKYKDALGGLDWNLAAAMVAMFNNGGGLNYLTPQYHSGGFVGGKKSNEEFAKLLNGEYVATQDQMDAFMQYTLPKIVQGTPSNPSSSFNFEKMFDLNVNGNLDSSVLPQMQVMMDGVVEKLNKLMNQRGYMRNATSFAI